MNTDVLSRCKKNSAILVKYRHFTGQRYAIVPIRDALKDVHGYAAFLVSEFPLLQPRYRQWRSKMLLELENFT